MAKHYLIGIGGTGARVVEAVLHCCAAGFAPEGLTDLTVFLVDPDEGNGNLSRTKTLVAQYQRARDAVAERDGDDVRIFGTPVAAPDPFVWGIFSDQNMSLGRYINHELARKSSPQVADLMEVLFSGEELGTRLNEGFRGHPSIGAVVMANTPDDVEPWQSFWADVESSQSEGAVRVFLVGSIFGGTGAAGVPTFGAPNMLKWDRRAALSQPGAPGTGAGRGDGQSKIFLGAALVLPYFTVEDLPAERTELFVTPADFPVATKAALQYYDEKDASGKLAFDQVYLLGDSLPQPVGKFSPGNRDQQNRPHYVEVAGALAALDFFRQEPAADAVREGPRFFAASRSGREVDWRALPVTRDAGRLEALQTEFERRVAAMTVFAYTFNTLGTELLSDAYAEPLPAWYKSHFVLNPKRAPRQARAALEHVAEFNRSFLAWVAALDDGDDEEGRVRLVDRTRLFAGGGPAAGATSELVSPRTNKAAVGGVLKGVAGQGLTFDRVRTELDTLRVRRPGMPAASLYVNLFYEAALRFVDANYRLGAAR
jgi:hypothetical protein